MKQKRLSVLVADDRPPFLNDRVAVKHSPSGAAAQRMQQSGGRSSFYTPAAA